jgi:glycosyltransferase involved in cell wall biosynthesis
MTSASPLDLVSVVIPCYKQAHFLGEAIESVRDQTHPHYEIVVVDDESPDNTIEVAGRYSDVRYIRQRRQERSAARNRGLSETVGKFVVFLDADDRLLPHHFESCLEAFQAQSEAGFVCGDYRWYGDDHATHVHDCRPRPDHYGTLLRTNFIGPPHAVMFRRDAINSVGGFPLHLKCCEDQDLYLRVARNFPVRCHHTVIAEYRRHEQQTSQRWDLMLRYAMEMLRSHADAVEGHPEYEQALRAGLEHRRHMYGDPLIWATVAAVRSRDWQQAMKFLRVLLRWYPQGVLSLIRNKMDRLYETVA